MLQRTDETTSCLAENAGRGPRYTSYPPATEFAPLKSEGVRVELGRLGAVSSPLSLYVHVPFCKSLCAYCGCNVIPTRDEARGVAYIDQLVTEMTLLTAPLQMARLTEISIGGGSPNFLAPASMRTLMTAIERYFSVDPHARRSIELDPRWTSPAQVETLAALKFTSLSIGVQDFSEPVQDAIRRHQSVIQTRWLVDRTRAAGFDDINIDIVYGLPRQTVTTFGATLDAVIDLAPDRVALFGYAHLPDKLPHQRLVERAGRVLDPYERAELLLLAIERFTNAGYLHLGLDHFAKPGSRLARAAAEHKMIRTFQGYVERLAEAVIGIGTSAISSSSRMLWQNHAQLPLWEEAITARRLPVHRGIVLDRDDRIRRAVIDKLMCEAAVNLASVGEHFGVDSRTYFARELASIATMTELAAFNPTTQTVTTTDMGRLLVRNVCMVFDRYFEERPGEVRFSQTI